MRKLPYLPYKMSDMTTISDSSALSLYKSYAIIYCIFFNAEMPISFIQEEILWAI